MHEGEHRGYVEDIPSPAWLYALVYGVDIVFIVVIVTAALTDSVSGGEAAAFYPVMLAGLLVLWIVTRNFLTLRISADEAGLQFGFGIFRKRFAPAQIASVDVQRYSFRTYLGWGIRFAPGGRRAWSVIGPPEGVVVHVREGAHERAYFISSRRPHEAAGAIRRLTA